MAIEVSNVAAKIVSQNNILQHGFMHLPYVSLVNDRIVRLRDDSFMSCIRLEGLDASTTKDADLDALKQAFSSVLAQVGTEFAIYTHKISRKVDFTSELETFKTNDFAAAIDSKWTASLRQRQLRDNRLTISVVKTRRLKRGLRIFSKAEKLMGGTDQDRDVEILEEVIRFIRSAIGNEKSRVLGAESGQLLGFLGSIQTGNEQPIYPSRTLNVIADEIVSDRITFDAEGFHLTDGPDGDRYGVIRSLKAYPSSSWVTVFDEFALPCDYVITQSFVPMGTNEAADRIASKRRIMRSTADAREEAGEQIKKLNERVLVQDASLGHHHFTVSLISKDKQSLREMVSELDGIASNVGARLVKDSLVKRANYFAQFPGNLSTRTRVNIITSSEYANFASFHRSSLGKSSEELPWETPIAVFPTSTGSPFRFSFHRQGSSEGEPPAGHTLILGETGSGKSVLASFLMTQARRTGARIFLFDYRKGLEMMTRAMGGSYSTIESGLPTGLNPLWVETDSEGVDWLTNYLTKILAPDHELTPIQTRMILDNVRRNAEAAPALRRWDQFAKQFASTDDDGDLQRRVAEWAERGRFGWVFGETTEDTFSLDGDVVGFDLTQILDADSERERMAVLSYIFRRIERKMLDRQRTIVLIDEGWRAIDNPYFASVIEGWLATLRKQHAIVVMLTQNPDQLARSKVGSRVFSFFPTQILFPDPKSSREDYQALRLNDAELQVVTSRVPGRHFLLRDDQTSVVLDGDASSLGDYLHILGGGRAGLSVAGEDYRNKPDFWRGVK